MQCIKYYTHLDSNKFPIPSTEFGTYNTPCDCTIALLNPTGYPTGNINGRTVVQSYHPQGLRYWFRVSCDRSKVIPNSLFISKVNPGGNTVEYIKTVTI